MKNRIYQSLLCLILLGNFGGVSVTALESNTYGQANFSETSLSTDSEKLVDGTSSSLDSTIDLESQVTPDSQPIKEGIIQSDDQVLIRNTTVDPYRKIVSLESYFPIGSGFGTGVMIGPDLVLTAAHNVYDVQRGQWVQGVQVVPARDGQNYPYGSYQASQVFILKGYKDEVTGNSASFDMALIKLSQKVDSRVGYLEVSAQQDPGQRIQIAGYPATTFEKIGFMYGMFGEISGIDGDLINYQIDTESGQSGSPVLNETNQIIAIHILGFVNSQQEYIHNAARRVQEDSLDMIAFAKGEQLANDAVDSHWLLENPVYRLYHAGVKRHLYTQDENEINVLKFRGWQFEGKAFATAEQGNPVYRLYSPVTKEHLYTTNQAERDVLATSGWNSEGIAWYSYGERPVYRLYHTGLKVHLYTSDSGERDFLINNGWNDEGISFYAL